jgi:hypothetical protein
MSDATTARADYLFKVSEYADGTPWIFLELRREPNLPVLGDGFLGMGLRPGTSLEEAKRIAHFLNENITHMSATTFQKVAAGRQ